MITDGCTILEKNDIVIYIFLQYIYTFMYRKGTKKALVVFVVGGSLFLQSLHVAHNQHTSMYQRAPLVRRLLKIIHERIALLCIKHLKVVAQCLSELYCDVHIVICRTDKVLLTQWHSSVQ